jgi:hypothetical protein
MNSRSERVGLPQENPDSTVAEHGDGKCDCDPGDKKDIACSDSLPTEVKERDNAHNQYDRSAAHERKGDRTYGD